MVGTLQSRGHKFITTLFQIVHRETVRKDCPITVEVCGNGIREIYGKGFSSS